MFQSLVVLQQCALTLFTIGQIHYCCTPEHEVLFLRWGEKKKKNNFLSFIIFQHYALRMGPENRIVQSYYNLHFILVLGYKLCS